MDKSHERRGGWSWWYLLFLVQFALALWPPLYNKAEPLLIGIPFFYWFQLALVFVAAVFTAIVYFATDE
jgi:ABC-type microcin C transport system permease subunit YejE